MDDVIHVSWTGGWDSSFRVLDLLIRHGATVQPHYVMSPARRSLRHELTALQQIREQIRTRFPYAEARLLPTRLILLSEIPPNDEVTRIYDELRSQFFVPDQYEWINRYIVAFGLDGLEIGMHSDDDTVHSRKLRVLAEPVDLDAGVQTLRLPASNHDPDLRLFRRLAVPIIKMRKAEMGEIALDHGFLEILEASWFCHFPLGDQPCGACHPCRDALHSSMGHRLNAAAKVRYRIWPLIQAARVAKASPERARKRLEERLRWRDFS